MMLLVVVGPMVVLVVVVVVAVRSLAGADHDTAACHREGLHRVCVELYERAVTETALRANTRKLSYLKYNLFKNSIRCVAC